MSEPFPEEKARRPRHSFEGGQVRDERSEIGPAKWILRHRCPGLDRLRVENPRREMISGIGKSPAGNHPPAREMCEVGAEGREAEHSAHGVTRPASRRNEHVP